MIIGGDYIITHIQPEVDMDYSNVKWKEATLIEATTNKTIYEYSGSKDNVKQENLYREKNMEPLSSKHYYHIVDDSKKINVDTFFPNCFYLISYLKVPAGNNLWWHKDYYHTLQKKFDIKKRNPRSIYRTLINLNAWHPGQIFQVETDLAFQWKKGQSYTFQEDVWHGVGNFSLEDYIIMQVTWIDKKDVVEYY